MPSQMPLHHQCHHNAIAAATNANAAPFKCFFFFFFFFSLLSFDVFSLGLADHKWMLMVGVAATAAAAPTHYHPHFLLAAACMAGSFCYYIDVLCRTSTVHVYS
jgi:hypothetical protein